MRVYAPVWCVCIHARARVCTYTYYTYVKNIFLNENLKKKKIHINTEAIIIN